MKQNNIFLKSLLFLMAMVMSMQVYAQKMIFAAPDKSNQKVIKRYNRYHHRSGGYSSYGAVGFTAVFGVRTNSIMSTDDVEVNVVKRWIPDAAINDQDNRLYFVEIKNKSDQTIYVDKAKCFRIYNRRNRFCYYDAERDDTSSAQRIIAIPPHATRNLSDYKAVLTKKSKYSELKIIDYPEDFNWDARSAKICEGFLNSDEVRSFPEDASPYYRSFLITYSKEKDFSTYSFLTINFYMRQLIGRYYPELYRDNDIFERLGADKYTITNCEYGYGGVNRFRRY